MKNKIMTVGQIRVKVEELHKENKKVIATSGCFDIIHAGHVMYLQKAAECGDCLIVFLNSDFSVRRLKGDKRPIVSEDSRALVVAALEMVDYVGVFDEDTPCEALSIVRPDCFVKGGEYKDKHIPEEKILAANGGTVKYIDMVQGKSTTNIVERIKEIYKEG